MTKLPREKTQTLLREVEESFPHGLCNTCECFLGYLAQLRIDSDPADKDLFIPFKVKREDMHKCLGCEPCPPGELYARYAKEKRDSNRINV